MSNYPAREARKPSHPGRPRSRWGLTAAPTVLVPVGLAILVLGAALHTLLVAPQDRRSAISPVHAQGVAALPRVAPATPWQPLPLTATLTRIGVGSCLHQSHPQPIWSTIVAAKPQLFLMLGDNVYGDVKGPDMAELVAAYRKQGEQPEFAAARAAMPFLATWDDHDYGANDAGAGFPHAAAAADLFHDFWQSKPERTGPGLHYARLFGPAGRRVQVILLDTRSFRSPLRKKSESFPHWGRYEPDPDPGKTMLGADQWAWLAAELRKPADVRLVVSSIQVLAEGHGFERWGNLPAERARLMALIDSTDARGVLLLSGDRHMGAVYRSATPAGQPVVEMTASSLNRSYGPSKDARLPPLVSEPYRGENFGLIDIDWSARRLAVRLQGLAGEEVAQQALSFDELGIGR